MPTETHGGGIETSSKALPNCSFRFMYGRLELKSTKKELGARWNQINFTTIVCESGVFESSNVSAVLTLSLSHLSLPLETEKTRKPLLALDRSQKQ